MKIAVCIKQVPAYSEGTMDSKTGVLIRDGLESTINPYDLPAIETALKRKEQIGDETTVDVFTMGPIKAISVVREAYTLGVDRGFLLSDTTFKGADVLATSYTLMQAIKSTDNYDLILCGKQTTDGDTAQVSGALAKWLNIPHINWVTRIIDIGINNITIEQKMEENNYIHKIEFPCLLSVERSIFVPRMPNLKLKIAAKKKDVVLLSIENMDDKNEENYGLSGSATKVEKIYPVEKTKTQKIVEKDGAEAANYIFNKINELIG